MAEADLLVHVVDASSPTMQRQVEAVEQVLEEIGAGQRPILLALNKVDALPCDAPIHLEGKAASLPAVRVSALRHTGIEDLLRCISETLLEQFVPLNVLIPYDRGELVAQFHAFGTIEDESYEQQGTRIRGYLPQNQSGPFMGYQKKTPAKRQRIGTRSSRPNT